jgi:hypothetical protein
MRGLVQWLLLVCILASQFGSSSAFLASQRPLLSRINLRSSKVCQRLQPKRAATGSPMISGWKSMATSVNDQDFKKAVLEMNGELC